MREMDKGKQPMEKAEESNCRGMHWKMAAGRNRKDGVIDEKLDEQKEK